MSEALMQGTDSVDWRGQTPTEAVVFGEMKGIKGSGGEQGWRQRWWGCITPCLNCRECNTGKPNCMVEQC